MTINFTKDNIREFEEVVMAAIAQAVEPLGVTALCQGGRFSTGKLSLKIDLNVMTEREDGEAMPASFPRDATRIGIPTDCFGSEFNLRGTRYKVCGLKTRNPKYPVLARALSGPNVGSTFKMDARTLRLALGNA